MSSGECTVLSKVSWFTKIPHFQITYYHTIEFKDIQWIVSSILDCKKYLIFKLYKKLFFVKSCFLWNPAKIK